MIDHASEMLNATQFPSTNKIIMNPEVYPDSPPPLAYISGSTTQTVVLTGISSKTS
jgi:hypothetical protein